MNVFNRSSVFIIELPYGKKYIKTYLKARIGYREKNKVKKRIAAVTNHGLLEFFKVKEDGSEASKSFKKIGIWCESFYLNNKIYDHLIKT